MINKLWLRKESKTVRKVQWCFWERRWESDRERRDGRRDEWERKWLRKRMWTKKDWEREKIFEEIQNELDLKMNAGIQLCREMGGEG